MSDIDFFGKKIHVRRQVQGTCAANLEIVAPKYGSVRAVYVSDEVLAMMSEHIRLFCPGKDPDRWMFVSKIRPGARLRGWHGAGEIRAHPGSKPSATRVRGRLHVDEGAQGRGCRFPVA